MENLNSLEPCELIILALVLTFIISDDLDAGDLNVLGNFISAVGSLVSTWAAQQEQLKSSEEADDPSELKELKCQVQCLQEKCERLEQFSKNSHRR